MSNISSPSNSIPSLEDNDALLTYRVGPVFCCGPTLPIMTITPPPPLTHPPGSSTAEPGIFKHGNVIVSATDLRYRFGVKQENWRQPGQIIIAQHDDQARGYFVDEILDVIRFPESGWGNLPALLPRGIFSRTLLINKKIFLYADFSKLSTLQGSGYLAEYIEHLEKIETQEKEQSLKGKAKEKKITDIGRSQKDKPSLESNSSTHGSIKEKSSTKNISTPPSRSTTANTETSKLSENKSTSSLDSSRINEGSESRKEKSNLGRNTDTPKKEVLKDNNQSISNNSEQSSFKNSIATSNTNTNTNTNSKSTSSTKSTLKNKEVISTPLKTTKKENKQEESIKQIIKPELNKATTVKAKSNVVNYSSNKKENKLSTNNIAVSDTSTQTTQNPNNEKPKEQKTHSGIYFVITVLLFLVIGSLYVYQNHINSDRDKTPIIASTSLTTTNAPLINDDIYNNNTTADQLDKPIDSITQEDTHTIAQEKNENILTTQQNNNSSEYRATINKNDETITIELNGPLPPQIRESKKNTVSMTNTKTNKLIEDKNNTNNYTELLLNKRINTNSESVQENISPNINTDNKSTPANRTNTTNTEIVSAKQASINNQDSKNIKIEVTSNKNHKTNFKSIEIIHIIVKGDTLWAIAKHYLQNPFLYPELAKLSKIKNPDLIYPGNRVIIIYKD